MCRLSCGWRAAGGKPDSGRGEGASRVRRGSVEGSATRGSVEGRWYVEDTSRICGVRRGLADTQWETNLRPTTTNRPLDRPQGQLSPGPTVRQWTPTVPDSYPTVRQFRQSDSPTVPDSCPTVSDSASSGTMIGHCQMARQCVRQFRQFRQFRYFPTVPTVSNSFKNVDLVNSPGLTRINVDVSTILQKCREYREPLTIAAGFV